MGRYLFALWIWGAAAALAQQVPQCTSGSDAVYPCAVGGTLLVTSAPSGSLFSGSGGGGGGGGGGASTTIINDPANPGFSVMPKSVVEGNGPGQLSFTGTLSLASVSGQATLKGISVSVTCGVTGAATANLTVSTPGGPLVVKCPTLSTPGASMTVTGQGTFAPVSSLTTMIAISATLPAGGDSLTLTAYSLQTQVSLGTAPTISGLTNGADFSTHFSPGVLAAIYGANLWGGTAGACPAAGCSGLSVTVGSKPAYVVYASASQLTVEIPYEAAAGASNLTVALNGAASAAFPITLAAAAPAFFTQNVTGTGPAVVQTPNGSAIITYALPAVPGGTYAGSATGLGATNPPTATGTPTVNNQVAVIPTLTIGGMAAKVVYAGVVPGFAGYDQINFTVPAGVQGTQPIVLTSGAAGSSSSVTIPIAGISQFVSNARNASPDGFGSTGLAAPGEIATVFANGLGTTDQIAGFPATTFQGTQVTFNGTAAPLFHLIASTASQKPPAPQQIDLLVPQELPTSGTVNMQLTTAAGTNPNFSLKMAPAAPGLYRIQDPAMKTRFNIIAQFANTVWLALPASTTAALKLPACTASLNPLSLCGQPATPGDYLVIYMTGLGITTPNGDPNGKPLATGAAPPADGSVLYETPTKPAVTIGGVPATILYSGLAPGYPGEYQLDVQVPPGVAFGDDVPVVVTMLGNSDTATVSVQPRAQ